MNLFAIDFVEESWMNFYCFSKLGNIKIVVCDYLLNYFNWIHF